MPPKRLQYVQLLRNTGKKRHFVRILQACDVWTALAESCRWLTVAVLLLLLLIWFVFITVRCIEGHWIEIRYWSLFPK